MAPKSIRFIKILFPYWITSNTSYYSVEHLHDLMIFSFLDYCSAVQPIEMGFFSGDRAHPIILPQWAQVH